MEREPDTRRYPRLKCFVAVEVRSKDSDLFAMGNLASIGRGGCGIETESPVNIGVTVQIAPIESEATQANGVVVNRRILQDKPGFGLGIEFADSGERVAEFVKFMEGKTQVDDQAYWYLKHIKRGEEQGS